MTFLAQIVLWAVLAWGVLLTLRAAETWHGLRTERSAATSFPGDDDVPHVVLLIPALREQDLLHEVVAAARDLTYPSDRLHIVVVTTEREDLDRHRHLLSAQVLADRMLTDRDDATAGARLTGIVTSTLASRVAHQVRTAEFPQNVLRDAITSAPTTRRTAAALLTRLGAESTGPALHHLHYAAAGGAKSSQLAFAVQELDRLLPAGTDPADTYVGVYDADSQPDRTTLLHLARITRIGSAAPARPGAPHQHSARDRRPRPVMVQQLPVLLRRPHAARNTHADLLLRAHAVADLRRRMGVEAYRIRALARLRRGRWPAWLGDVLEPVVYGIGAGLFVRRDVLVSIGMYEEPVDDLLIGYKLSSARADIAVLPVFNLVDRYARIGGLWRAYSLVALGSVLGCLRLARDPVLRTFGRRNTVVLMKEGLDTLWWFVGPPTVILAVVMLLGEGHLGAVAVWGVASAGYLVVNALLSLLLARWMIDTHVGARQRVEGHDGAGVPGRLVPMFLTQPLLHWLGPVRLIGAGLAGILSGRKVAMGKTER